MTRYGLLRFLLEISGYTVAAYASAAQFLQEAPLRELSCLVVDQHMPELTGLQLVARLRGAGVGLPVALITGSPSADVLRLARELSVARVLEAARRRPAARFHCDFGRLTLPKVQATVVMVAHG